MQRTIQDLETVSGYIVTAWAVCYKNGSGEEKIRSVSCHGNRHPMSRSPGTLHQQSRWLAGMCHLHAKWRRRV